MSTELGHETASGAQGSANSRDGLLRLLYPMQYGIREDGVISFAERKSPGIADFEADRRMSTARLVDHFRRTVETDDLRARGGHLGGQMPGPATEIQDPFARTRRH